MITIDALMERILEVYPEVDPLEAERVAFVETEIANNIEIMRNIVPPDSEIIKNALDRIEGDLSSTSDPIKQASEIESVEENHDTILEMADEEQAEKPEPERVEESSHLYEWALRNTAEAGDYPRNFITNETVEIIKNRLERVRGQFMIVTGYQGQGKTTLRLQLEGYFDAIREGKDKLKAAEAEVQGYEYINWGMGAVSLKWIDEATTWATLEALFEDQIEEYYPRLLMDAFAESRGYSFNRAFASIAHKILNLGPKDHTLDNYARALDNDGVDIESSFRAIRELVPKVERVMGGRKIRRNTIAEFLRSSDVLLLEFPDFSRGDQSRVRKALSSFQKFFEQVFSTEESSEHCYNDAPSLVIFWQREMPYLFDHFYSGKYDVIELEPYKPELLVDHFIKEHGNTQCFTEEALFRIAQLSRGIPRLFKRYVAKCLDGRHLKGVNLVRKEHVDEWVTQSQLVADYSRELELFFPKSKYQISVAVRVLNYLQKNDEGEGVEQETLAKEFFGGDNTQTSRMLDKLEYANKVRRVRQGKKNLVRLYNDDQ